MIILTIGCEGGEGLVFGLSNGFFIFFCRFLNIVPAILSTYRPLYQKKNPV